MSKFYDETMQSLHQAVEIAKGTLPAVPVEGLPAETYRVTGIQDMEIIKELKERLENVPDAYPDFVEATIYYARKKPERMKAVMGYLSGHPGALSSDIVEFVSKQPDFMEDAAYDEACRSKQLEEDEVARKIRILDELNEMLHPINDIDYDEARYREPLENTEMQLPVKIAKIDYKALIRHAKEKGVQPCDLEKDEQEMFVIHKDSERIGVMTEIQNSNIERFEELMGKVQRDGKDKLMEYIREKSDFYTAPASTKYHLSCEGGLLQHSLNVYDCLMAKKESPVWKDIMATVPEESIIIMSLLHDLCKTNFYIGTTKNQKTYDPEKVAAAGYRQVKHDDKGDFVWETVNGYDVDDKLPFGHGEKSVFLINWFMRLSMVEALAIRWHMGFSGDQSQFRSIDAAMEKVPIVLALYEADLEASKILEGENGNKAGNK